MSNKCPEHGKAINTCSECRDRFISGVPGAKLPLAFCPDNPSIRKVSCKCEKCAKYKSHAHCEEHPSSRKVSCLQCTTLYRDELRSLPPGATGKRKLPTGMCVHVRQKHRCFECKAINGNSQGQGGASSSSSSQGGSAVGSTSISQVASDSISQVVSISMPQASSGSIPQSVSISISQTASGSISQTVSISISQNQGSSASSGITLSTEMADACQLLLDFSKSKS